MKRVNDSARQARPQGRRLAVWELRLWRGVKVLVASACPMLPAAERKRVAAEIYRRMHKTLGRCHRL